MEKKIDNLLGYSRINPVFNKAIRDLVDKQEVWLKEALRPYFGDMLDDPILNHNSIVAGITTMGLEIRTNISDNSMELWKDGTSISRAVMVVRLERLY